MRALSNFKLTDDIKLKEDQFFENAIDWFLSIDII